MQTPAAGRKTRQYRRDTPPTRRSPIAGQSPIWWSRLAGIQPWPSTHWSKLTKDNHADSTRYAAATALLDRGYGRPAQSVDLHLSADAITKRLSDMTDAELAALEARMVTIPATLALEHVDEPQADGDIDGSDTDAGQDGDGGADDEAAGDDT